MSIRFRNGSASTSSTANSKGVLRLIQILFTTALATANCVANAKDNWRHQYSSFQTHTSANRSELFAGANAFDTRKLGFQDRHSGFRYGGLAPGAFGDSTSGFKAVGFSATTFGKQLSVKTEATTTGSTGHQTGRSFSHQGGASRNYGSASAAKHSLAPSAFSTDNLNKSSLVSPAHSRLDDTHSIGNNFARTSFSAFSSNSLTANSFNVSEKRDASKLRKKGQQQEQQQQDRNYDRTRSSFDQLENPHFRIVSPVKSGGKVRVEAEREESTF